MSSQSIRNEITLGIRRVITDIKRKVISEGRKKIMELKDQLLSPDTIIKILSADINQDSCSVDGRQKMEDKAKELKEQLNKIEEIARLGLDTLTKLEEKISVISFDAKEKMPTLPPIPNPIDNIKTITDALKIPMKLLGIVIRFAPGILASSSGPAASGAVIANTNNNVNLAKVKIAEFKSLFLSLPNVLDSYIAKADIVFNNITKIKSQIQQILNEIDKLKAFIIYLELDFEGKCDEYQLSITNTDPPVEIPPSPLPYPLGPLTLQDVINASEKLYGSILENLIATGQSRGIKRVYALGAQLQRIKNTRVEHTYF